MDGYFSSRYISSSSGSTFDNCSINYSLFAYMRLTRFSGTGSSLIFSPLAPSKKYAFRSIISTKPLNLSFSPIGIWTAAQIKPNFLRTESIAVNGFAPSRSNLLMNMILGTLYLIICLFTVRVWGCTPATPQISKTPPSKTLRALSTSIVKSICPGVSMRLMS